MCFSAPADLIGGAVVGVLGVDALRHVDQPRQRLLGALPLLFGLHQVVEAFVWWGLQGHVPWTLGRTAVWIYLVFAFAVLPVYVPLAMLAIEPTRTRQRMTVPFAAIGAGVTIAFSVALVNGPVTARLARHHISYSTHLRASTFVAVLYVIATCGSLIVSGLRRIAWYGALNLVVVGVLADLALDGFASLWCAWAAVTSGAIALHLRIVRRDRPGHDRPTKMEIGST